MKRILSGILVVFLVFEAVYLLAATYQPQKLGYVDLAISSGTVAAITRSTAPMVGHMRWCYDCTSNGSAGTLCVSTGTTVWNQYILSTGTVCK